VYVLCARKSKLRSAHDHVVTSDLSGATPTEAVGIDIPTAGKRRLGPQTIARIGV